MMRRLGLAVLACLATLPASAAVTGFVNNVSGNSLDFANFASTNGLATDSGVDFTTAPLGTLAPTFYQASHGLTLSVTNGEVIDYNTPPLGSLACPCSTGEGAIPYSRLLLMSDQSGIVASFDSPVAGFGFFYGDKYDPNSTDATTLEAFTGANGTGSSLGVFTVPHYSYQLGYQLFVGIASATAEIGSVVVTDPYSGTGDGTTIDSIKILTTSATTVPEPASLALLLVGTAGALAARRRH